MSGHLHVIWVRDGKTENVSVSLEKLANFLCDHGEVDATTVVDLFGLEIAAPRPHPKDMKLRCIGLVLVTAFSSRFCCYSR